MQIALISFYLAVWLVVFVWFSFWWSDVEHLDFLDMLMGTFGAVFFASLWPFFAGVGIIFGLPAILLHKFVIPALRSALR